MHSPHQISKQPVTSNSNSNNCEFSINIYNYFLEDFPKKYHLSPTSTIEDLQEMISFDIYLQKNNIKSFKDQNGKLVSSGVPLYSQYPTNSNLNMEIFFIEGLKVSTHNKKIAYFMVTDFTDLQFTPLFNQINSFHQSEKGGKIVIGVEESGYIKGICIHDQDLFRRNFISALTSKSELGSRILLDVEFSFFRVKNQYQVISLQKKNQKLMLIKIKGRNQQSDDFSQNPSEDKINQNQLQPPHSIKYQISKISEKQVLQKQPVFQQVFDIKQRSQYIFNNSDTSQNPQNEQEKKNKKTKSRILKEENIDPLDDSNDKIQLSILNALFNREEDDDLGQYKDKLDNRQHRENKTIQKENEDKMRQSHKISNDIVQKQAETDNNDHQSKKQDIISPKIYNPFTSTFCEDMFEVLRLIP